MNDSSDRILTTHAGSLARPAELREMLAARDEHRPYDTAGFAASVRGAVAEVVRQQIAVGLDVVNDGEQSKRNFTSYARERLGGIEERALKAGERPLAMIYGRDAAEFPEYFAVCWGSYHGPHKHDLPLRDFVDLILAVRAQGYSIEASNPRHDHEWRVWEDVRLPEGKILIPGVVGHASDFVEHPELVSERLIRYARLVGRERVIAGTDCGLGPRVGHPKIAWAKFEALVEGARLATRALWR